MLWRNDLTVQLVQKVIGGGANVASNQCKKILDTGKRCKNPSRENGFCWRHEDEGGGGRDSKKAFTRLLNAGQIVSALAALLALIQEIWPHFHLSSKDMPHAKAILRNYAASGRTANLKPIIAAIVALRVERKADATRKSRGSLTRAIELRRLRRRNLGIHNTNRKTI